MKQTKRLTRAQREYLNKHHVNTENCRLIEETKDYIDYQKDGQVYRLVKGGNNDR